MCVWYSFRRFLKKCQYWRNDGKRPAVPEQVNFRQLGLSGKLNKVEIIEKKVP